jgi:hypothetical protein
VNAGGSPAAGFRDPLVPALAGQELTVHRLAGLSGSIRFNHPEASHGISITSRLRQIIGRGVAGRSIEELDDVLQLVTNRFDNVVVRPAPQDPHPHVPSATWCQNGIVGYRSAQLGLQHIPRFDVDDGSMLFDGRRQAGERLRTPQPVVNELVQPFLNEPYRR